jgi:hypothetical protein
MQRTLSLHAIARLHELHAVHCLTASERACCHVHHAMVLHLHSVCCLRLLLLQVVHMLLLHVWVVLLLLLLLLLLVMLLLLLHAHRPAVSTHAGAGCHAARHLMSRLLGLLHVLAVIRACCCCCCRRYTDSKTTRQQDRQG